MIKQRCLIIDEEEQSAIIADCQSMAQQNGFNVEFLYYNPKQKDFLEEKDGSTCIVFSKVKQNIKDKFLNQRIDIILCDYDFKAKGLDGFEFLRWLRNEKTKTILILYSGKSDFENEFVKDNYSREPKEVASIIRAKIDDIIPREDRKGVIFKKLQEEKSNLEFILENELYTNGDLIFQSVYPHFKGLKLKDIANEISKSTTKGNLFKEHLIELSVAHMIDLNRVI